MGQEKTINKNTLKNTPPTEIHEMVVYSKIGMALVSIQRVEAVAKSVLEVLILGNEKKYGLKPITFDGELYEIDKLSKYTLGNTFRLLKFNPELIIEDELDKYRDFRNSFVHSFWQDFLDTKSEDQKKMAIDVCYELGLLSNKMESFFKGFLYFLALRIAKDDPELGSAVLKELNSTKGMKSDFDFFVKALKKKSFDFVEFE